MIDKIVKQFEELGLNIVKKTKRSFTVYIKFRDFFDYDSSLSQEVLKKYHLFTQLIQMLENKEKEK